ncbi:MULTISPECIES: hypothetical protein [unclassified Streptomyces]|uniref:hypothetical protein n=1 Tax=unclassified Streptomyces TaxID=2593676 RepID=UPI00336AB1E6
MPVPLHPAGYRAVGHGPVGIAMAPDGAHAYVSNFGSGTVSVLDTATDTVSMWWSPPTAGALM